MKNKKRFAIIVLVIMLAVGFAAVSTSLIINGNSKFVTNVNDFDVYFSFAEIDGVDESDTIISSDGKTITYTTNDLKTADDTSILGYEITNNSSQYDAKVSINCTDVEDERVEVENILINDLIEAKSLTNGTITVKLLKSVTEEKEIKMNCTLNVTAIERDTVGVDNFYEPDAANTYSIYGHLVDESNEILANANLVVYSENPHYVTTDANGYFYVEGLERGSHEIYYIGSQNGENKTKDEIKEMALDKINLTTSTKNLTFESGIKIDNSTIERTKNVTYLLDFETNGGVLNETKQVTHNKVYGNLPVPVKDGYTFVNWKTEDGKVIDDKIIVSNKENHTLYADWKVNTYTVAYNGNGSTSGSTASSNHTYDEEKALTANGFSRSYEITYNANGGSVSASSANANYTFSGWATTASGSVAYTNQQSVKNLSKTDGATVNLYAVWSGGKLSSLPTPTRVGYNFNGWFTAASGGTKVTTSTVFTASTTIYAQWTLKTYAVGTVVTIGSEKFNVISDNGSTVTMLASYGLNGSYRQSTSADNVIFTESTGWAYTPGPKEIDIFTYSTNPKTYVNNYVSYLKTTTGDTSLSGNLITVTQLGALGCTISSTYSSTGSCTASKYASWIVNGESYWTRSALSTTSSQIFEVRSNGPIQGADYGWGSGGYSHIRPIITMNKIIIAQKGYA